MLLYRKNKNVRRDIIKTFRTVLPIPYLKGSQ